MKAHNQTRLCYRREDGVTINTEERKRHCSTDVIFVSPALQTCLQLASFWKTINIGLNSTSKTDTDRQVKAQNVRLLNANLIRKGKLTLIHSREICKMQLKEVFKLISSMQNSMFIWRTFKLCEYESDCYYVQF